MQKALIPLIAGFAVAFAINFMMSLATSAAGEKDDNTGLFVAIAAGALTSLVVFNLSGNRRTAPADPTAKQRALAFAAEPGKAALYLMRTGFVGKMAGMNLALDGREVAQLKSPRFTRLDIAPGAHTLTASFGGGLSGQTKPSSLAFEAGAGDIVVIKLGLDMGLVRNGVRVERVALDGVRADLTNMAMTAPDVTSL